MPSPLELLNSRTATPVFDRRIKKNRDSGREFTQPSLEEPAFRRLLVQTQGSLIGGTGFRGTLTQPSAQVGARGVGQVVVAQVAARQDRRRSAQGRPAGPSRMATATARFNSTTGDGSMRDQHVVQPTILRPVGRGGRRMPRRARPQSRPASCTRRSGADESARCTERRAFAICARFHSERS